MMVKTYHSIGHNNCTKTYKLPMYSIVQRQNDHRVGQHAIYLKSMEIARIQISFFIVSLISHFEVYTVKFLLQIKKKKKKKEVRKSDIASVYNIVISTRDYEYDCPEPEGEARGG